MVRCKTVNNLVTVYIAASANRRHDDWQPTDTSFRQTTSHDEHNRRGQTPKIQNKIVCPIGNSKPRRTDGRTDWLAE